VKYFYSIKNDRCFKTKIKRSVFICSLRYVETIPEAKKFISEITGANKQATHNCWAYIVGDKGNIRHSSDHGEPPGTAGKPMLNALETYNITNISAVVTRHFGGVKLGIKGLIDAYRTIVKKTIEMDQLIKLVKTTRFLIEVPYTFNDTLVHHLKTFHGKMVSTSYTDIVTHIFEWEGQGTRKLEALLDEYRNSGKLKYIIL